VAGWLIAPDTWRAWVRTAPEAVRQWAARSPLEPRMPLAALGRALGLPDAALLGPVLAETDLVVADGRAMLPAAPSDAPNDGAIRALESRLREEPFRAPDRDELHALGLARRELAAAEHAGRLLRISEDIVLLPDAPDRALAALGTLPQPFTASQARAAWATTRRVAIPLLEYLDHRGGTERVDGRLRRVANGPSQRRVASGPSQRRVANKPSERRAATSEG
jgi:selenocysteine-specific elongation factor